MLGAVWTGLVFRKARASATRGPPLSGRWSTPHWVLTLREQAHPYLLVGPTRSPSEQVREETSLCYPPGAKPGLCVQEGWEVRCG